MREREQRQAGCERQEHRMREGMRQEEKQQEEKRQGSLSSTENLSDGSGLMKTALFLFAALLLYDLGKQAGRLIFWLAAGLFSDGLAEEPQGLWYGLSSMTMQLAGGGVGILLWKKQIRRSLHGSRKIPERNAGSVEMFRKTAAFFVLAVTSALGLNLFFLWIRLASVSAAFQETAASQAQVPLWLGVVLFGFVAPFSEEVLFRGVLYGKARETLGRGAAMVFSGLLFGIYHGNPVQGVYAFLLGMLLAFVYERAGTILAPVLFHGMGNLAVFLVIDVWNPEGLVAYPRALGGLCAILFLTAAGCFAICFGKRDGGRRPPASRAGGREL